MQTRSAPITATHDRPRPAAIPLELEPRHAIIAQAAYFRAKRRGFAPGHELEDWLAAQTEVDATFSIGLVVDDRSCRDDA